MQRARLGFERVTLAYLTIPMVTIGCIATGTKETKRISLKVFRPNGMSLSSNEKGKLFRGNGNSLRSNGKSFRGTASHYIRTEGHTEGTDLPSGNTQCDRTESNSEGMKVIALNRKLCSCRKYAL